MRLWLRHLDRWFHSFIFLFVITASVLDVGQLPVLLPVEQRLKNLVEDVAKDKREACYA